MVRSKRKENVQTTVDNVSKSLEVGQKLFGAEDLSLIYSETFLVNNMLRQVIFLLILFMHLV